MIEAEQATDAAASVFCCSDNFTTTAAAAPDKVRAQCLKILSQHKPREIKIRTGKKPVLALSVIQKVGHLLVGIFCIAGM